MRKAVIALLFLYAAAPPALAQTTAWGWTSLPTLGLLAAGLAVCGVWILVELRSRNPLVDLTMMRVRGVWTVNLAAFLLGAGLYAWFLLLPQLAQLPASTGFGYGASVVAAGPGIHRTSSYPCAGINETR